MIDHIFLSVRDFEKSKAFFLAALRPLGYEEVMAFGSACGLGVKGKPDFWIGEGQVGHTQHIAFRSSDRARVRAFHEAALKAGGRDNGAPGLRPNYHPAYYGAFVFDPDGNNIEAVTHLPE
jgi:catechol 2,3-dioxygenase-like lactoylglutathione lyase family enzyme